MDYFLVYDDALDQRGVKEALALLLHQLNILNVSEECVAPLLNNMVNRLNRNLRKVFRRPAKRLSAHCGHRNLAKSLSVLQINGFSELVQNLTRLLGGLLKTSVDHGRMQTLV